MYSHWWFALGKLGLTREDNFLFGGTMVLLFCVVALLNLSPRSRGELAWQVLLLLSPPVMFAINRANNDLAIFSLIGAGLWLARRPAGARPGWLGAAVFVATGLKFFPVVAAFAPVLLRPVSRGLRWTGVCLLAALVAFASVREDFLRASFPVPDGVHVFGAAAFWRSLGQLGHGPVLLSLALLAAAAGWLARRRITAGLAGPERAEDVASRLAFMVGALILLACFSAGMSYAYRWIFALWLAPWLWQQAWIEAAGAESRLAARAGCVLLTVSMWMDGAYCFAVNSIVGTTELGWLIRLESRWNICMQPVVWALMLLLAGWVMESIMTTVREWRREVS